MRRCSGAADEYRDEHERDEDHSISTIGPEDARTVTAQTIHPPQRLLQAVGAHFIW